MASDLRKPDYVTTLYPYEIEEKMWPLPIGDLFMVGPATERRLRALGINYIGDLAKSDPKMLRHHLGDAGMFIWDYANGIGSSRVIRENIEPPKSYSKSTTLPYNHESEESLLPILLSLCSSVSYKLRRDNVCAGTVSLFLKDPDFVIIEHQKKLPNPTDVTHELFETLRILLAMTFSGKPVRAIGIAFSNLSPSENFNYNLFDGEKAQKHIAIDQTSDNIKTRFGRKSIRQASELLCLPDSRQRYYDPKSGKPPSGYPF